MTDTYIHTLGTSVPGRPLLQSAVAEAMVAELGLGTEEAQHLRVLYRASGITYRHSVLPDFHGDTPVVMVKNKGKALPSVATRMQFYRQHARNLGSRAALQAFDLASYFSPGAVTHLITVSCTGMYAPGLDIDLVHDLDLPGHTHRSAINFMGCYGAFNGLKMAQAICQAQPEAVVLVVCVELCTLHFQHDTQGDALLAASLFADGAAAALVSAIPPPARQRSLRLAHFACDLVTEGQQDMAWEIGDFGFQMHLSTYVPDLIGRGLGEMLNRLFASHAEALPAFPYFAIHPGGKKILTKVEEALGIGREQNRFSHEVLRRYGNMSSATVLFVLQKIWNAPASEHPAGMVCCMAFGPGLTIESAVMELS